MSESDRSATTSLESISADLETATPSCPGPTRRALILTALAAGIAASKPAAAAGIVAYSAICSHAGCPVTGWLKGAAGDNDVLKCFCHNSEFDPRHSAEVVFGPALRRLAALPLTTADGSLTVAATFVGKVGGQQGG